MVAIFSNCDFFPVIVRLCVCECVLHADALFSIHLQYTSPSAWCKHPPFSASWVNFLLLHSSARLHEAHLLWLHYHKWFYNICLSIIILQIPVASDLCSEWTPGVRHCLVNESLDVITLSPRHCTQPLQLEPGTLLIISPKLRNHTNWKCCIQGVSGYKQMVRISDLIWRIHSADFLQFRTCNHNYDRTNRRRQGT